MKRDLKRLQKHFPAATVAELTGARLMGYFEGRRAAHKTFNNRRGCAVTFAASQAAKLMGYVEEHYPTVMPFFALCLFAGILPCLRTGEILRLQPAHIKTF